MIFNDQSGKVGTIPQPRRTSFKGQTSLTQVYNLLRFALLLSLPAAVALAADKPQIGPPPPWVKPVSLPTIIPPDGNAAVRVILNDQQANFSRDADEHYAELVVRVQTAKGLQDMGTISIPWNPDVSTLTVHKLHILRGDQVIDVLADGPGFTVLRRENNLEGAMLDGVLTATIQPPGLQIGDTVDLATTVRISDPAMAGKSERTMAFWPVQPTLQLRMRAHWGQGVPIRWHANAGLTGVNQVKTQDGAEVRLAMDNVQPEITPKAAPLRYQQGRHIEFTSFGSWAEIAAQFAPLYQKAARLSPQSPLRQVIARIRAGATDPVARAEAALSVVQDQVRYFFAGTNDGGLIPAAADTTWARRFGDCKGKTVLLLAMLQALGIEATAVLVSAENGDGLNEHLPMVGAFDHVLVRAVIGGRTYWLDGTRTGDRHLGDIAVPAFYWGLPLLGQGSALVPISPKPLSLPGADNTLRIDASAGMMAPAPVHAQIILRGDLATSMRLKFDDMPQAELDERLRTLWLRTYDYVKIRSVSARYDDANAQEILTMDGTAQLPWSAFHFELPHLRLGFMADFERPPGPGHDAPYAVAFPMYTRISDTIVLPPGVTGFAVEGEPIETSVAGLHYSRSAAIHGNVLEATASARSVQPEFPASDAEAAQTELREMFEKAVLLRAPRNYRYTPQDVTAALSRQPKTAEAYWARGATLLDHGYFDRALADLDQSLKMKPNDPRVLAERGLAYVWKKNNAMAQRDFDAALAIDPHNVVVFRGRGLVALNARRYQDAVDAFTTALSYDPGSTFALEKRQAAYDKLGNHAAALADSKQITRLHPDLLDQYEIRAGDYARDGQYDKAANEAVVMTAANPASAVAWRVAGVIYALARRDGDSALAFTHSLQMEQAAGTYVSRARVRHRDDMAGRSADIDAALKIDPKDTRALLLRAGMQRETGRYADAVATLDLAIAAHPDDTELKIERGVDEALEKRDDLADADFAAARAKAGTPSMHNNLCWLEAAGGVRLEAALSECNAAVAGAPDDAAYLDSRGFVLLRLGRMDEAITSYNTSLHYRPRQAVTLFGKGVAEMRKGDAGAGKADIAAAQTIDPDVAAQFASYGIRP